MNKAEKMYYELEGVIRDIDNGLGFDDACYNTVKRTQEELQELSEDINYVDNIKAGNVIQIPVNKDHANAMIQVALFYLEQYDDSIAEIT